MKLSRVTWIRRAGSVARRERLRAPRSAGNPTVGRVVGPAAARTRLPPVQPAGPRLNDFDLPRNRAVQRERCCRRPRRSRRGDSPAGGRRAGSRRARGECRKMLDMQRRERAGCVTADRARGAAEEFGDLGVTAVSELRPVQAADPVPSGVRADQHVLGQVLTGRPVTSQDRGESQHPGHPRGANSSKVIPPPSSWSSPNAPIPAPEVLPRCCVIGAPAIQGWPRRRVPGHPGKVDPGRIRRENCAIRRNSKRPGAGEPVSAGLRKGWRPCGE